MARLDKIIVAQTDYIKEGEKLRKTFSTQLSEALQRYSFDENERTELINKFDTALKNLEDKDVQIDTTDLIAKIEEIVAKYAYSGEEKDTLSTSMTEKLNSILSNQGIESSEHSNILIKFQDVLTAIANSDTDNNADRKKIKNKIDEVLSELNGNTTAHTSLMQKASEILTKVSELPKGTEEAIKVNIDTILEKVTNIEGSDGASNKIDEALTKLKDLATEKYEVKAEQNIRKSLVQEYNELVNANLELKNRSCVGMRIRLVNSDVITVNPSDSTYEYCYINEVVRTTDYTFNSEYEEYVIVFFFANAEKALGLDVSNSQLDIIDIYANNVYGIDSLDKFTQYLNSYDVNGGDSSITNSSCVRFLNEFGCSVRTTPFPIRTKNIYSEASALSCSLAITDANQPDIKKLEMPNLENWSISSGVCISTNSPNFEIEMKNLKTMTVTWRAGNSFLLSDVWGFKFPESIQSLSAYIFKNIKKYLDFSAVGVASFDPNWYAGTAPSTLIFSAGWQNTINLAVAGKNQNKEWFLDLFNKLANVESKQVLTIPITIYNQLTTDEKSMAKDKNWDIQGG